MQKVRNNERTHALNTNPMDAFAEEEAAAIKSNKSSQRSKPFAPLHALLPAPRLKLWVGGVHALSQGAPTVKDPKKRLKSVQEIDESRSF